MIELVEYGDYQCPHCGHAYPIIKAIQQKFGSDLTFVFRNFPLSEVHPQARIAAIATEAANMQGRFWEMHDVIFENQKNLLGRSLTEYARRIGLDTDQFQDDLKNNVHAEKVQADFESGLRSGVNRTPSFFINGEKYDGNWEEEAFSDYLENKIKSKLRC
jgi:protein-disulfide isomerase